MINHSRQKFYSCSICDKKYYSKNNLNLHIRSSHNDDKCDVCGKNFPSKYSLDRHRRIIHRNQPYDKIGTKTEKNKNDDFGESLGILFNQYNRDPTNFLRQGGSSNFPTQGGGKSTNMISCPLCGEKIDPKDVEIHNMINHF